MRTVSDAVRARAGAASLRAAGDGARPVLFGHFAIFNRWTEIDSWTEGHFMERVAPGAFAQTFAEDRAAMRVLFQHGFDPQTGDKPLGPIDVLREDAIGGYYEVPLLDTLYVAELVPGLAAGVYGASFRFRTLREHVDQEPGLSDHNPLGLPERTVLQAVVPEFGPVTFPAYPDASANVRSLTDWWRREQETVRAAA